MLPGRAPATRSTPALQMPPQPVASPMLRATTQQRSKRKDGSADHISAQLNAARAVMNTPGAQSQFTAASAGMRMTLIMLHIWTMFSSKVTELVYDCRGGCATHSAWRPAGGQSSQCCCRGSHQACQQEWEGPAGDGNCSACSADKAGMRHFTDAIPAMVYRFSQMIAVMAEKINMDLG